MILEGSHIPINTASLRSHIGKSVTYLLERDIDKSGRGYYRPKRGIIAEVYRKNILIDDDWFSFASIREITEAK